MCLCSRIGIPELTITNIGYSSSPAAGRSLDFEVPRENSMRNPKQSSTLRLLLALTLVVALLLFAPLTSVPEGNANLTSATAVCNFADTKQVSIRYVPPPRGEAPRIDKLWSPEGHQILLFTETKAWDIRVDYGKTRAWVEFDER